MSRLDVGTIHELIHKQISSTYNTFMYLSLPIPSRSFVGKVTLANCLDLFCKEETLDKENAWYCPSCKTNRKATKRLNLSRLPPVLMIHLKRFSYSGPFSNKVDTHVHYPLKSLDLTDYMSAFLPPPNKTTDDPRVQTAPCKYDLYAVTEHHGTLSSGHCQSV